MNTVMTDFIVPPSVPTSLPVRGSAASFPVARVFCIGRNYPWQAGERRPAQMPAWFMKPPGAVFLAEGILPYPPETADFCHEVELVVAIAEGGRNIAPDQVMHRHVWGYACGLDLTRRDLQQQAKQVGGPWEPAKAFDFSAPCTPIAAAAQCGDLDGAELWLNVNGERRQQANIADLLWSVPELIAMLSRSVMLMPGDLVFTGTPAGVGSLRPGDVVDAAVAGIGQLSMTVGHAEFSDVPVSPMTGDAK